MTALISFAKFHGLGNDFVIIDARDLARDAHCYQILTKWQEYRPILARFLCDRNFGIGADGLILAIPMAESFYEPLDVSVKPTRKSSSEFPKRHSMESSEISETPDSQKTNEVMEALAKITDGYPDREICEISWVYTNSDGTDSAMCGNGLRALGLFVRQNIAPELRVFKISTAAGAMETRVDSADAISVELGKPETRAKSIPAFPAKGDKKVVQESIHLEGDKISLTCASMGNPHAVVFDKFAKIVQSKFNQIKNSKALSSNSFFPEELAEIARKIQNNEAFPKGVNVEFVHRIDNQNVEVLVYERGCGPTLACASGAAATVVAGVLEEKLSRNVSVRLPGGSLQISWDEKNDLITMEGPAKEVFSGVIPIDLSCINSQDRDMEASCT